MALLVFASGCAALVFQVAWMRELRLVFGSTTAAVAAVLAIFMAGLGLGSALLGRVADRVAKPLWMYGALEVAIGLSVAVSPWLIALAGAIYIGLGGQESLGLTGATVLRLGLATAVMAVPTFLMGGTLPAAVRAVTHDSDAHRGAVGVIYGANTLGAVFGTAVATFFALEHLGTRATLWTGCAIGLAAGALAIARARTLRPMKVGSGELGAGSAEQGVATPSADAIDSLLPVPRPSLIYLTAAVLGFTFFALELVWYRMLSPILGGTAFTFGLILCIALLGIGVGGIAYRFIFSRLRPSWSALAITCGCEALFVILPFALGDRLAMQAAWRWEAAESFGQMIAGWSYVTAIVVLPVALVSGVQFPLLTALLGEGRRTVSHHLGMTYAWNTLGAICGSLAAGFGGIPLLTAPGLWQVLAAMLAALSVVILLISARGERWVGVVVGGLALATFGSMFADGPTAAWRHSGIGAGRTVVPAADRPNPLRHWRNAQRRSLVWEADGLESSIGIMSGDGLSFVVNGKSDGNSLTDAPTQIGVAILGAVLHRDPQSALVIGLGTGESAGWLAEMRNVRHVDVVEIEPAIDEMARRSSELNWDVLDHDRVRRIYNDGREFVFTTGEKYDVVISEPSNPYRAGIATLYTTEFYQAVRERLNPGGVFVQFVQAYEVDEQTIETVLATVRSAFPHVEVWQTLAVDLQLVCSTTPLEYSTDELRARISSGTVRDALEKAWNVEDVEGFLGRFVASSRWADEIAAMPHVVRNTDDRTVLEYSFARTVGRAERFSVEEARDRLRAKGYHRPSLVGDELDWNLVEMRRQEFNMLFGGLLSIALLPRADDRALVEAFDAYRNHYHFERALELWPATRRPPSGDVQRLVLAHVYAELGRAECLELLDSAQARYPIDSAAVRAIYHWRAGQVAEAAVALEHFFARLAEGPWVIPVVSETAFSRAVDVARVDPAAAQRFFNQLVRPFASGRFGHLRVPARFMIAQTLGPEAVVEALAEMEPYVIWTADFLEPRAEAYAAVGHPLAERAQRDWQRFQRQRREQE